MSNRLIRRRSMVTVVGTVVTTLIATSLWLGSLPAQAQEMRSAVFAGGCFWCMEPPFDKQDGVLSTTSGYIGGTVPNPTYRRVVTGSTGHTEAVEVIYDPEKITYERLLEIFWRNIDPLDAGGQFCDRGSQYRSEVFVQDETERELAEMSRDEIQERFNQPIATAITDASEFYPAEDYHQNYYLRNSIQYQIYRLGCRRDARLESLWGSEAGGS